MRHWLILLLMLPLVAIAAPDRAGLIQAWEAAMAREGTLEAQPDGSYRYRSEALDYDGPVKLLAAVVSSENANNRAAAQTEARGTVDFELSGLSEAQKASVAIRSWMGERQYFVFAHETQAWVGMLGYYQDRYSLDGNEDDGQASYQSRTWWFGDIGLLLGLAAVVVLLLWAVARQARKASSMYREAREINQLARENIERARELHEANAAAVRESLELARRKAETLDAILLELRRGSNSP